MVMAVAASLLPWIAVGCTCRDQSLSTADTQAVTASAQKYTLNQIETAADLAALTKSPHPMGSSRQRELAHYIVERTKQAGIAEATIMPFVARVPNPQVSNEVASHAAESTLEREGLNVAARIKRSNKPSCLVMITSHYDTKIVPGVDYVGANDSGSSSVLLLDLARFYAAQAPLRDGQCDIMLVWFDGEESTLPNWDDGLRVHPAKIQDNTYGSRHIADSLTPCMGFGVPKKCWNHPLAGDLPIAALINIDMIGLAPLRLTRESYSSPKLLDLLDDASVALNLPGLVDDSPRAVGDDHVSFLARGVPAIDLINFQNLTTWHQAGDIASTINLTSVEQTGRVALFIAEQVALKPRAVSGD